MMRRPTLHDVARAAGVSHMTVSRVVRGEGSFSQATAAKVLSAIQSTGYRPDPALSALAAYRERTRTETPRLHGSHIAFLDLDQNLFSDQVRLGAETEAPWFGYTIEHHFFPTETPLRKQLLRALHHRGVEGLLFGPSQNALDLVGLDLNSFACVALGALPHRPPLHAVAMDYFYAMGLAHTGLVELGATRIGLCLPAEIESRTAHQWLGSYLTQRENQPPPLWGSARQREFASWVKTHELDGVVTLPYGEAFPPGPDGIRVAFLNSFGIPDGIPHVHLDPQEIGMHGVRVVQQLLKRRELGLPARPVLTALRGSWRTGTAETQ